MERISAPLGGYKVEAYTARTEAGWTGVARVVHKPAGEAPQADVVVERLGTSVVDSEQKALQLAEEKARQAVLRRLLQGGA